MENNVMEQNKIIQEKKEVAEKVFWEALDFGRSGIRMLGKLDNTYRVFSSDFVEIDVNSTTRFEGEVYDDFIIVKAPNEEIVGRRFVKGDSMGYHHGIEKRADTTANKTSQENTYINFAYAIATNILKKGFSTATTEIRCGVCIPSSEYFSDNGQIMKSKLTGTYEIKFPMLEDKSVIFKIDGEKLALTAEGVVALVPLIKTANRAKVVSNIVVVVDVGHGSTDITIAINGKPSGKSSRSYSIGGFTIETAVARYLEEKNYGSSRSNVLSAIKNGWIRQGLSYIDVSDCVIKAKKEFAEILVEKIKEVVTASGRTPNEVGYFYFVGRAFLPSKYVGDKYDTKDLRDLVIEAWPVPTVDKLELVAPVVNKDMIKEIRVNVSEVEADLIGRDKVQADEAGNLYYMKEVLTTLEGEEIIPAEVANVTGVSLLLR